jgi:hypothetical protein
MVWKNFCLAGFCTKRSAHSSIVEHQVFGGTETSSTLNSNFLFTIKTFICHCCSFASVKTLEALVLFPSLFCAEKLKVIEKKRFLKKEQKTLSCAHLSLAFSIEIKTKIVWKSFFLSPLFWKFVGKSLNLWRTKKKLVLRNF